MIGVTLMQLELEIEHSKNLVRIVCNKEEYKFCKRTKSHIKKLKNESKLDYVKR